MVLQYRLRGAHPAMAEVGFALQWFPRYVQVDERRHSHDVVEMNYVVGGAGVHRIGDREFATGPGSLGITHYGQAHDIVTTRDGVAVMNLYLDLERRLPPDPGADLAADLRRVLPLHPSVRHRRNQFVHLQFAPAGEEERLLRAMHDEQQRAEPGWREAMLALLRQFLIGCARHVRRHALYADEAPASSADAAMEAVRRGLDADPASPVDVAAIARRLDLSEPYLCRAFKRYAGVPIVAYVHRQRLAAAMAALRSTAQSVTAIALANGFNDVSFFNRKFRAVVGMTPSEYRRSGRAAG